MNCLFTNYKRRNKKVRKCNTPKKKKQLSNAKLWYVGSVMHYLCNPQKSHLCGFHWNWLCVFFSSCSFWRKKQMWRQCSYWVKETDIYHLSANVLLVTRFWWLLPSLRLSHHSLLLLFLFLFLFAHPILMSLCSVKVTTQQHFVQRVLQWLVWNKDKSDKSKQKAWLNGKCIPKWIGFMWWGIKCHENTYMLSLPRPCLGRQAVPTSVPRPLHIGQSTCKIHNRVNIQFGSMLLALCFNILINIHKKTSAIAYLLLHRLFLI